MAHAGPSARRADAVPAVTRAAALALCALVLLAPRAATAGARAALETWWTLLVPALLPFLLAAEAYLWGSGPGADAGPLAGALARACGLPRTATPPLLAAWLAGYPAAAALADRWVRAGRLSRPAASRLVALGSVPDPMFVAALWAPALTRGRALPLALLAVQYAALVPVALYLRRLPPLGPETASGASSPAASPDGDDPLARAARGAASTLLLVAVAAAVVGAAAASLRALVHTWTAYVLPPWWREVAAGAADALLLAAPGPPLPAAAAIAAASALSALGGAVLWLETWALTRAARLDLRPFAVARLLHAATAGALAGALAAAWPLPLPRAGAPAWLVAAPPPWRPAAAAAFALFGLLLVRVGARGRVRP
ncbi:MAG: hypothetical protein K6V73_03750 [Firmicutes bacterium]|nr:hypothetical protein [Bacillota bacterium]